MIDYVREWLRERGYSEYDSFRSSKIFSSKDKNTCVIIDFDIRSEKNLAYTDYTHHQNSLMYAYDKIFRFIIEDETDLIVARGDLDILESLKVDPSRSGDFDKFAKTRPLADATAIEAGFENTFIDLYGRDKIDAIIKDAPFIDINGTERYYDFLIEVKEPNYFIAVEQNGEQYHHPVYTKKEQYKKQLLKQNSFIGHGNKLYRWSLGSMIDNENFSDDIIKYLGDSGNFLTLNHAKANRDYKLYEHQERFLDQLRDDRLQGIRSALVVLPTGTGKTEILKEELQLLFRNYPRSNVLVLVPTKNLKMQTQDSLSIIATQKGSLDIHTYSWMGLHYHEYAQDYYDYVAVDEAHHALASTLRRTIQYFNPGFLLGMTATDKRLDKQRLEDVFGQYETDMTLKEAILKGILAPIHAFRVKSNLDLSKIRFNGKDYVASDLERRVKVDSRNELIAKVLEKYFTSSEMKKQGIVFCVNVQHAKRMAKCLRDVGIKTEAVAGKINKSDTYLKMYERKELQFLTCCSLISEGWDSPQTSVIVMARPTMSKVLYTQQIGRGTRRCDGKEALYIIDVVDNYGALNNPWSIHALTRTKTYKPWANLFNPEILSNEELIIDGLVEEERKIEEIDIFTFEEKYGDYLSTEQLARELFVSTGTVKNWIRKEYVVPDITVPFGRSNLAYFAPHRVETIRVERNLEKHDLSTIYKDFWDFIEKWDYTMSYKMVFILSFLALVDRNTGRCKLDKLISLYSRFYKHRISEGVQVDNINCPYTEVFLHNVSKVSQSILKNPFEKYERKRFMFHAKPEKSDFKDTNDIKDLNVISFSHSLWNQLLDNNDLERLEQKMKDDLRKYYEKYGGLTDFSFSAVYRYSQEADSYVADSDSK